MNITTIPIQGQACNFLSESFTDDKYLRGGVLAEPVKFQIGKYALSFETLYIFPDSGMIYGGFLSEPHTIEIGTARNKSHIASAFFYYDSEEIQFAQLESDTMVKVKQVNYTFAAGEDLFLHPNRVPMRGKLSPVPIKVLGKEIKIDTIGFWQTGVISGIIPLENIQLEVQGKMVELKGASGETVHSHYSIDFSLDGQLKSITLSDGSLINFSFDVSIGFSGNG